MSSINSPQSSFDFPHRQVAQYRAIRNTRPRFFLASRIVKTTPLTPVLIPQLSSANRFAPVIHWLLSRRAMGSTQNRLAKSQIISPKISSASICRITSQNRLAKSQIISPLQKEQRQTMALLYQ